MALTSGFYNSVNGDRKYNAEQLSSIFDGLINDGILYNVGNRFNITALSGNNIQIGSGRAWFNHTWVYNDSNYTISLEDSSPLLNRIDAVVLEINRNSDIRSSQIMIIKGEESSSPSNPTLIKNEYQNQYPLAYIYRKANSSSITQEDITIKVGTEECPYVTGILPVEDIDKFIEEASNDIAGLKYDSEVFYNDIENNSYKIGDLKTSARKDLGSKWLLCNGSNISISEYPDLCQLISGIGNADQWGNSSISQGHGDIRYVNGYYVGSDGYYTTDILSGSFTKISHNVRIDAREPIFVGPCTYGGGRYYIPVAIRYSLARYKIGVLHSESITSSNWTYAQCQELDSEGDNVNYNILDCKYIEEKGIICVLGYYEIQQESFGDYVADLRMWFASSNPTNSDGWWGSNGYYRWEGLVNGGGTMHGKINYINGQCIVSGTYDDYYGKSNPAIFADALSMVWNYYIISEVGTKSDSHPYYVMDVQYINGKYVALCNYNGSVRFAVSSTSTLNSSTTWTLTSTNMTGIAKDFYYLDGVYYVPDGHGRLFIGTSFGSMTQFLAPFGSLNSQQYGASVFNVGQKLIFCYPYSGSTKTIYYDFQNAKLPSISLSDSVYTYIKALE